MPSPVKIVAILAARPGKTDELKALLSGLAVASRTEPGNLRWDIWQDQAEAGRFVLDELYTDNTAVTAHRATPHFTDYLARINDLAERTAMVLDPAGIAQT
jgi:quinol monooxygenase YgiN